MIRARRTRETGIPADHGGACRGDVAADGVETAAVAGTVLVLAWYWRGTVLVGMRDIAATVSTSPDLGATAAAAYPGDAVDVDESRTGDVDESCMADAAGVADVTDVRCVAFGMLATAGASMGAALAAADTACDTTTLDRWMPRCEGAE